MYGLYGKNNPTYKDRIKKIYICGNEFEVLPYLVNIRQYCSKKCSEIGLSGENNSSWKGGVSFLPYCEKFNDTKKEEIRNQYNRKCYICKKDEKNNVTKNGKIRKLSVHHMDEDKEQGCNGKKWKPIPLCLHCHVIRHFKNKKRIL